MAPKKSKLNPRNDNKSLLDDATKIITSPTKDQIKMLSTEDEEDYEMHDTSGSAYIWLLFFSTLMFTLPFLTFYGVKQWIQNTFGILGFENNCISVFSAVLVVNLIICLYVMKAFREDTKPIAIVHRKNK